MLSARTSGQPNRFGAFFDELDLMSGLESMSTLVPLLVSPEAALLIKDATRHFLKVQQWLSRGSSYKEEKNINIIVAVATLDTNRCLG